MSFSFGNTAVAAPVASSGFSFGANTAAPTAAPAAGSGGFSFGAASAAPAASSGGFSFGATPAPAAASGGFSFGGSAATSTAAPVSSGGFGFGAASPATTTSSNLFGGGNTGGSTSLFGGGAAPSTGTSLFGGGAATTGTSLFGAKPAGTSMFGGGATATTGFTGFNAAQPQQHQSLAPTQPAITLETVFDSLPVDVKKNITDFHQFLKEEDQSDAFLKSVSARKQDELKNNLEQLEQDVLVRRNLQDRQATAVHHIRKDVKHLINQVDNATLNLRSMSGESTSQRFYGIMRRVEVPSPYYWELLDSFEGRMEQIKTLIENVESEYRPLYEKNRSSVQDMDPAMLHQIMIAQNTAMIQLAAQVAEVHEKTEEMRQAFIRKMKEDMIRHGETNLSRFKNPFDKRKKANHDSDIDNIRFKTSVTPTIVQQTQPQPQPTGAFGFGNTNAATPGFGATTTATPGFGAASTGTSLFGAKPTITTGTTAPAASGGFSFGSGATTATTAAPKQVSFSLGGTAAPTISTGATSAAPAMSSSFSFGASTPAPAAGASSFGSTTSAFLPPTATPALGAGDKRTATSSGGLRTRQKKR